MKDIVIADSSGIVSLFFSQDKNNNLAIAASKIIAQENKGLYIPSDVFSETINVIGKKFSHTIALQVGNELITDNRFIILTITETILQKALVKFKKQPESVSFTDCIVMATADHFKTKEIFGFDKAFNVNGYIRLGIDA